MHGMRGGGGGDPHWANSNLGGMHMCPFSSFPAHLRHLKGVLGRFYAAGIQLRVEKCTCGYDEVKFLGHLISKNGKRPLPTTLWRIALFLRPISKNRCVSSLDL